MTFPSVWISRISLPLSLGVVLMLPLTVSSEELVGTPPPSTLGDKIGEEFVGPPAPLPDQQIGDKFVGPPLPPPVPDSANVLDKPRDYLSGEFVDFVTSIDRFFGDDRHYQEANDSVVQLDIIRVMGYGGERKFVWSARANVRLPIAEQKLHLLVETDPDKSPTVDPKKSQSPPLKQPSTPQSYAIALRYEKAEAERLHFSTDAGIQLAGIHSAPFARARASVAVPMELWRSKLAETLFWFNSTGAGSTTQLDLERPISEPVLFRATSVAAWLEKSQYFDLRQDLSFIHRWNERTALLYQASAIGVNRPSAVVNDYVLLMLYRYRLHREWMFLEISPQLHFPRERAYHQSAALSLQLQMLFDESK